MTVEEMIELFDKAVDARDFRTPRNDVAAFVLLDKLVPREGRIIGCAEHDQIWLSTDLEELAEVITEADIQVLVNNGVWVDEDVESLSMFV